MLEYDFEESIAYWVCMTARALEQALNEELTQHGITYRQWQVLAWLALEGELTQSQLAEKLRIEAPTLVGILDRMERDGWITRQPDAHDRRKKLIRPTPRVQPVWETVARAARQVRARASQHLTPDELHLLKKIMTVIRGNLHYHEAVEEPVR